MADNLYCISQLPSSEPVTKEISFGGPVILETSRSAQARVNRTNLRGGVDKEAYANIIRTHASGQIFIFNIRQIDHGAFQTCPVRSLNAQN